MMTRQYVFAGAAPVDDGTRLARTRRKRIAIIKRSQFLKWSQFLALLLGVSVITACHKAAATTAAVSCSTTSSSSTVSSSSSCTDSATGISIAIAPATVTVNVSTGLQFSDAVSGGTNNVVIWKVNDTVGGNDTVGRIDSNGFYRAPSSVPSPATVTVSVVSYEDPALSASGIVTISPPPQVTVSPASGSLTSGSANTKTFTATVTGANTTNVNWLVNGVLGGNATFGTISSAGVYTSPLTPPPGNTVTITAASQDFPQATSTATLTITGFSTSSFQGHFAFSLQGTNSAGAFFRAGSFVADGNGNLNSGLEDINSLAGGPSGPISFVGSYTVAADGRGTLQFADGRGPATFRFVLVNAGQLQIIGFEATGAATGQANAQDQSTFRASGLSGSYVFDFSGLDSSSKALSEIGVFAADGIGALAGGTMDINDGGALTAQANITSGTYAVNSNGRGTATLVTSSGTLNFVFYIVSKGSAKFLGIDSSRPVAGATLQQVPNVTFDASAVNGRYAFVQSGSSAGGALATAGSFAADGAGHLVSGVLDENSNGTPSTNVAFSNGAYAVSANGRGTATFTTAARTYTLVFYLSSSANAVFQETDSNITTDGALAQQQSTAFTLASLQGSYEIASSSPGTAQSLALVGQFNADGAGKISSGTLDVNTGGTLAAGQAVSGSYSAPAGSGRAVISLNPSSDNRNFAVYILNANQAFIVGIDSGRVASGRVLKQF